MPSPVSELTPLSDGSPPKPATTFSSRATRVFAAASALAVAAVVAARTAATPAGHLPPQSLASGVFAEGSVSIAVSNEYERSLSLPIGDGLYPFENLVEMYQDTRITLTDSRSDGQHGPYTWSVGGTDGVTSMSADATDVIEVKFIKLGVSRVQVTDKNGLDFYFDVTAKYVRRELRDLFFKDREMYFDAVHVIYHTSQEDGEKKYGSNFKSAAWLVREHLYGAAQRDCDHWHDDAGFLTHHVGITMQFEQSIRAVDPRTCSHYWDYTIDSIANYSYSESPIFNDDWFGSAVPYDEHHIVSEGRFAYTPVMSGAYAFSNITNPYGLLRSPWNTNPTPYLLRSNMVAGIKTAEYDIPDCVLFKSYLSTTTYLSDVLSALNGELHGPIHIMVGGHWDFDQKWVEAIHKTMELETAVEYSTDQILLASKFLWRQGYIECPDSCDVKEEKACTCSIRSDLWNGTDAEALKILTETGLSQLGTGFIEEFTHSTTADDDIEEPSVNLKAGEFLSMIGHVGHPGEMFTSAAPQDPLFWPLHGLAERFVQLLRLADHNGILEFDETWGYDHASHVLSDTHTVCDWDNMHNSEIKFHASLPSCQNGVTCTGHREDDLLPFEDLFIDSPGSKQYMTNRELYLAISPWNKDLPYVFDKLTTWPACPGGFLLDMNRTFLGFDDDHNAQVLSDDDTAIRR